MSRRISFFAVIFLSAIGLVACGGGGGSDSPAPVVQPSPPSVPTIDRAAAITRTNARHFAHAFSILSELSDDVVLSTPLSFSGPNSILLDSRNTYSDGNIIVDLTSICASGTVTSQGTFNEATSVGELKISYNNCENFYGYKYTGIVRTTIRQTDAQKIPTAFNFAFENYAITSINPQYPFAIAYNGITRVSENGGKITAITNMEVSSSVEDFLIKAADFVSTYSQNTSPFAIADSRAGHIADSNIGYATISSDASVLTRSYLTGTDATKIQIDFDSTSGYSRYSLDVGGDQNFDAYLRDVYAWSFSSDDSNNTPPASYTPLLLTPAANAVYQIAISAGDADQDFLSYSVSAVSSPNNVDMQLSVTDDSFINVHTSGSGDYVIKFSISDGRGGVTDSNITLHVPFDTPVVSIQPNAVVAATAGAPLTLDFAPTNNDALPATYALTDAPTGMTIDTNGQLTWTPTANPFFNAGEATATVTVSNADHFVNIPVSISVRSATQSFPLVRTGLMTPTNEGGIKIGDFDGDSKKEILVTDNTRLLYSLQNTNGTYKQNWVFPYDICGRDITSIAPLKAKADGSRDIAVQCAGTIAIIKYGSDQVLRRYKIPETYSYGNNGGGIVAADLDGDGKEELAVLVNSYGSPELVVLDADTLVEKWRSPSMANASTLAIGNVDNDQALEIVVSGEYSATGYVYDGITHTEQWNYSPGFGDRIAVGDVDGDGIDDIVGAGPSFSSLRTYSGVLNSPIWETPLSYSVCSMALAQLDGDAAKEILIGSCQSPTVTAYDVSVSGPVVKRTDTIAYGYGDTRSLVVGDVNDDGHLDLSLAANSQWSSSKTVTVYDLDSQSVLFPDQNSILLFPPYVGGYSLNIGGSTAALFTANSNTNGDVRTVLMNSIDETLSVSPVIYANYYSSRFDICLTDYDLDGQQELLLSTFNSYSPFLAAIDPLTTATKWSKTVNNNYSNAAPRVGCGDLNGDGRSDVVRAVDNRVIAYDIFNDQQIWGGFNLNGTPIAVAQADFDGDNKNEIVTSTYQDLIVYGSLGSSYVERARYYVGSYSVGETLVSDLDGDHVPEIIVAKPADYLGNATVIIFDKNLAVLRSFTVAGNITALGDISGKPGKVLVATTSTDQYTNISKYRLSQFDAVTGSQDWQSPPLVGPVSSGNLHYAPAESAVPERLMMGTSNAMYITR